MYFGGFYFKFYYAHFQDKSDQPETECCVGLAAICSLQTSFPRRSLVRILILVHQHRCSYTILILRNFTNPTYRCGVKMYQDAELSFHRTVPLNKKKETLEGKQREGNRKPGEMRGTKNSNQTICC